MITFVNPRSPFLLDEGVMPPLGLMYLVGMLKSKGIAAQIVDMGLGDELPDGDLFITGTTPQHDEIMKMQRYSYTVVGGPHASVDHENIIASQAFKLTVVGEGEEVIEQIVREKPIGLLRTTRIKNLDALPFPDRSNIHKYHYEIGGRKATTMITSRGCNGKCSFCSKAVMDKGVYFRSAKNLLAEVEQIKDLGYRAIMFYDDSIAFVRKRLFEFCAGMEKQDMLFRCFIRSDQVDEEIMSALGQAGCYEILVGVESGSQKLLDSIRKHETVEQNRQAIALAKKNGIKAKALMMVGLPGESWETVEESRRFILETNPDSLDITILSVYKGSDIHKNPDSYDLSFTEPIWYKGRNDEYKSTVSTQYLGEEEIVNARHSLWQTYINLKPI